MMKFKGRSWKFGDDVDTDAIIPARHLNSSDPEELATHCMEDADPNFIKKLKQGDIIFAGKNFGCGSSREHAPIAIKTAGVSCVVAKSFARIFYRNSFNTALPIFESIEASQDINEGDEVEVDADNGVIKNISKGREYPIKPIPSFMRELIDAGGLVAYVKRQLHGAGL